VARESRAPEASYRRVRVAVSIYAPPRPTPLRRNRDFTKLWVGEAVSIFGSRIAYVAYPLLVLAVTGSPAYAGLTAFLRTLPYFVLALPTGVLALAVDLIRRPFQARRHPRTKTSLRGEIGEGLGWVWREPFLRTSEFLVAEANLATMRSF
jgi:hypothetical protein